MNSKDKDRLKEEIKNRIEKSLSRFDDAGKEYDVSLGIKNGRTIITVKRIHYTGISHYVVKAIESILKEYRLSPVFYYIQIDIEESKPTIEITIA